MGEIAEMFLDGTLDEETGELIDGTSPGYPRRMRELLEEGMITVDKLAADKSNCPICKKRVKTVGLAQHIQDKHGETLAYSERIKAAEKHIEELQVEVAKWKKLYEIANMAQKLACREVNALVDQIAETGKK